MSSVCAPSKSSGLIVSIQQSKSVNLYFIKTNFNSFYSIYTTYSLKSSLLVSVSALWVTTVAEEQHILRLCVKFLKKLLINSNIATNLIIAKSHLCETISLMSRAKSVTMPLDNLLYTIDYYNMYYICISNLE